MRAESTKIALLLCFKMNKRVHEEDGVCSFFLERKKRLCRMKTREGMPFCPHHSHLGAEQDGDKGPRVPCPYDPSHFCYELKLQKHLKKCNAREKEKPEYFIENVNTSENVSYQSKKANLNEVSDEDLLKVISKIQRLYNENSVNVAESTEMHPLLKSEMERINDGFNNMKHINQQASLLGILKTYGFLDKGSCFVEFGAGKGQLMYWIVKCVPENENIPFLLVDKSAQRHKSENKFKDTDLQVQRIRVDIQHLHLGKIESIQTKLNSVVGVSKHLCGAATDLAIKCITNTLINEEKEEKTRHKALGLVMALCCHHRCSWNLYIGKDFMEKKGVSQSDFNMMCCMASWATCGLRKNDLKLEASYAEEMHNDLPCDVNILNRYAKMNLKHAERTQIGMQCKRLIDIGRVCYLEHQGYDAKLVTYVDKSVSLENTALIAVSKS